MGLEGRFVMLFCILVAARLRNYKVAYSRGAGRNVRISHEWVCVFPLGHLPDHASAPHIA